MAQNKNLKMVTANDAREAAQRVNAASQQKIDEKQSAFEKILAGIE